MHIFFSAPVPHRCRNRSITEGVFSRTRCKPTNHLDIQSTEVLKEALKNYEGTFSVVSHDREFLEGLTNRIWDIENKTLKIHHFGVQEFLKRKMYQDMSEEKVQSAEFKPESEILANDAPKLSYEEAKELKRKKNQLINQIKKVEDAINEHEQLIVKLDEEIALLDYSNEDLSAKLLSDYSRVKAELDQLMIEWEKATEELIEFED
jgi:ATP-binding cassette subfamily F protein 3